MKTTKITKIETLIVETKSTLTASAVKHELSIDKGMTTRTTEIAFIHIDKNKDFNDLALQDWLINEGC